VPRLAVAAGLVGAGTMVMEVAFTRLFSVLLFYHYVFLVLAVALLGLGLGAAAALALPDRVRRADSYAAGAATLAGVSAAVAAIVSARLLPVDAPILHGAVALVPFLLAGMAMSLLLVAGGADPGTVYGADLAGAAVGALLGYGLLYLGATTALLGAAVLIAGGGWIAGRRGPGGRGDRTLLFAVLAALFAANAVLHPFEIDLGRMAEGKPLGQWLERRQAEIVRTTWDPFGRVDVVRVPDDPLERSVFVDGAAGSALPRYPSDPNQETRRLTELGAFPYRLVDAERTLVVGSGGGIGVLYALLAGIDDVTAVEVSRGVIDAVRADGEYAGFLYDRPEVTVVADEGRSFLDRASGRYDVIDLSLVVSLATARSGYALTENYLFTEEAFASVLAHLTDDGIAAVRLYDDPTLTRAFVTAAAAIRDSGVGDAEAVRHLAVVFNPAEADRAGPTFYPMLLVSKRPMTETAARELAARADTLGFTVMFAPYTNGEGPFGAVARGEATLDEIQGDLQGGVFTPPTDARPFFFEMTGGLPAALLDAWRAVGVVAVAAAAGLAISARRTGEPAAAARRLGGGLSTSRRSGSPSCSSRSPSSPGSRCSSATRRSCWWWSSPRSLSPPGRGACSAAGSRRVGSVGSSPLPRGPRPSSRSSCRGSSRPSGSRRAVCRWRSGSPLPPPRSCPSGSPWGRSSRAACGSSRATPPCPGRSTALRRSSARSWRPPSPSGSATRPSRRPGPSSTSRWPCPRRCCSEPQRPPSLIPSPAGRRSAAGLPPGAGCQSRPGDPYSTPSARPMFRGACPMPDHPLTPLALALVPVVGHAVASPAAPLVAAVVEEDARAHLALYPLDGGPGAA
jgi:MFS family permease